MAPKRSTQAAKKTRYSRHLPAAQYTDGAGPIIIAIEKSAIYYDPPGTAPETEAEWRVVADSLGETLKPLVFKLLPHHDTIRTTEFGVMWRHLDLHRPMPAKTVWPSNDGPLDAAPRRWRFFRRRA